MNSMVRNCSQQRLITFARHVRQRQRKGQSVWDVAAREIRYTNIPISDRQFVIAVVKKIVSRAIRTAEDFQLLEERKYFTPA